ncbi:MAG: transglutaminase-like cysteine peptidase [Devosia sp.]
MAIRVLIAASLALLACAVSVAPSVAATSNAPLGYQLLCLKHPEQCKSGGASKVSASEDILATLKRVNSKVNKSIKPQHDRAGADVWSASTTSVGDCEDYALAKRRALINAGLPASSLRLAYVKTRSGLDHAVLLVKTSKGTLVLDNNTSAIRPLSQSGLRVISMQGANPLDWS